MGEDAVTWKPTGSQIGYSSPSYRASPDSIETQTPDSTLWPTSSSKISRSNSRQFQTCRSARTEPHSNFSSVPTLAACRCTSVVDAKTPGLEKRQFYRPSDRRRASAERAMLITSTQKDDRESCSVFIERRQQQQQQQLERRFPPRKTHAAARTQGDRAEPFQEQLARALGAITVFQAVALRQ